MSTPAAFSPMSMIGSDELSQEEAQEYNIYLEDVTKALQDQVAGSESAREWLNTPLGKSVRTLIATNKMESMKASATAPTAAGKEQACKDFAVWCAVQNTFGVIIQAGNAAFAQLELTAETYTNDDEKEASENG